MSRVRYYCAASLDGYIAESDDNLDWLLKYEGSFEGADSEEGQGGYEAFYEGSGPWCPAQSPTSSSSSTSISGPTPASRPGCLARASYRSPRVRASTFGSSNAQVPDLIDEMIEAAGDRDLWVVGGGNVASQFADNDLLDTVEVTLVPVVLGEGKPLFDRRLPGGPMQLTGARTYTSGMVGLTFDVRRSAR